MLSLTLADISVSYPGLATPALEIDRLAIPAGAHVAITGASGSGKSTFVNIVTGLERARRGRIDWSGTDLVKFSESRRDRWRAENVGLIMQDFHLFPGLSALENVLLPARLSGAASAEITGRGHDLLKRTGLQRPQQRIETMSRGEMQRVAVARALLRRPGVIIADEPTASLDVESGEAVGSLLLELAGQEESTLIVVSHDTRLTDRLSRKVTFNMGRIVSDTGRMERAA
ncbi:ABC transporter ATP-binding protein [Sinorhizobium fredii]|uniref:ABC transporter ATP-binding protein n=1 Tax=Rhizobium fredii TaxID=380 RepID=UPI0005956F00|nr:ATP-binding cassette domain-containing protein [Sinorhizobium fredii]WOS62941.1 ATP-binding cassette domain-containing protein [Sinorhizobium fredii GR64]